MINANTDRKSNRYLELDCLRGLACIFVILFHFTFGYDNGLKQLDPNKFYFVYGNLGVQLFFMISGFVIFMTLEKNNNPIDFIISRFSRLYPAYWAAIICTVILTTLIQNPFQKEIYSISQVFANFSMLQSFFKIKDVDGAYWTLVIELIFYALIWFLFLIKKQSSIFSICVFWLFLSFCFCFYDFEFEKYINIILILKHAPLFIGGIGFYLLKNKNSDLLFHSLIFLSLLVEYAQLLNAKVDINVFLIVNLFYVIFYMLVYQKLKFIINNFFVFLGSISYPLYLVHQNIGYSFIYCLKKIKDSSFFYLPISIVLVILISSFISLYIEQPAMKKIRNYYKFISQEKK